MSRYPPHRAGIVEHHTEEYIRVRSVVYEPVSSARHFADLTLWRIGELEDLHPLNPGKAIDYDGNQRPHSSSEE